MKPADLTEYATAGYKAEGNPPCPHYHTSPAGIAWFAGQWLRNTNRSAPRAVRMSRGYDIRANDMLLRWQVGDEFERIS